MPFYPPPDPVILTDVNGIPLIAAGVTTIPVSGTVTITGFPTAAAIGDALANPTVTQIGVLLEGFNGTTWDRLRAGAGPVAGAGTLPLGFLNVVPTVKDSTASGYTQLYTPRNVGDGDNGNKVQANGNYVYDATADTWSRARAAISATDPSTTQVAAGIQQVAPMVWRSANAWRPIQDASGGADAQNGGLLSNGNFGFNGATWDRIRTADAAVGSVGTQKVEQKFTPARVTADGQIKATAGFLHAVTIEPTTATPTAGLVTIYDSAAESGTILLTCWVFATDPGATFLLDVACGTGLFVGYDATLANVSVSLSYR